VDRLTVARSAASQALYQLVKFQTEWAGTLFLNAELDNNVEILKAAAEVLRSGIQEVEDALNA